VLEVRDIDIVIFKTFIIISALFEFIKKINKQTTMKNANKDNKGSKHKLIITLSIKEKVSSR